MTFRPTQARHPTPLSDWQGCWAALGAVFPVDCGQTPRRLALSCKISLVLLSPQGKTCAPGEAQPRPPPPRPGWGHTYPPTPCTFENISSNRAK